MLLFWIFVINRKNNLGILSCFARRKRQCGQRLREDHWRNKIEQRSMAVAGRIGDKRWWPVHILRRQPDQTQMGTDRCTLCNGRQRQFQYEFHGQVSENNLRWRFLPSPRRTAVTFTIVFFWVLWRVGHGGGCSVRHSGRDDDNEDNNSNDNDDMMMRRWCWWRWWWPR